MENEVPAPKKHRLGFIDVLRGIAVIWMIETHVTDVCLASEFKQATNFFYALLDISNGFVAVTFIFCAGAGFWLAAERKGEEYRRFAPAFWLYLRRLSLILSMGYWLHLPAFSLLQTLSATPEQLVRMFESDVLQNIVYSSLLSLSVLFFVKNLRTMKWIFAVLAVLFFFVTPLVWLWNPLESLPVFFAPLFAKPPISKFPLFPWSGYFFTGVALTGFFMQSADRVLFAKRLALVAFILPFVAFGVKALPFQYFGWQDWWYASPGHALFRVSIAAFLYATLFLWENKAGLNGKTADFLQKCGQESFFIYIGHLFIVYGSIASLSLRHYVGGGIAPFGAFAIFVAITAGVNSSAMIWRHYKRTSPAQAQRALYVAGIVFLILFAVFP